MWLLLTLWVALMASGVAFAQPASPVVVTKVVQETVSTGQTFIGTVVPVKRAVIGSAVEGRVVELLVEDGTRVEAGQPLAQLLTTTIGLEVQAAEAELTLREEELKELEQGTRKEEVEAALANRKAAEVDRDYASRKLALIQRLAERGNVATGDQVDAAKSAFESASARWLAADAVYQQAVNGARPEQIAQARARVAIQTAVVEKLKDQEKKYTIKSRFGGYVVKRHVEAGSWVSRGDPVAEVIALDQVDVIAHVLEDHAQFVRRGMQSGVQFTGIADRHFQGSVFSIVPQGDDRSRTIPVKVRLDNEFIVDQTGESNAGSGLSPTRENADGQAAAAQPLIKAGMLARVTLPTGQAKPTLLVPTDALVLGGRKPVIYVVDLKTPSSQEGTVRPVPVDLGVVIADRVEVLGSVEAGERVVVVGNERLRPGQTIRIISEVENATAEAGGPPDTASP